MPLTNQAIPVHFKHIHKQRGPSKISFTDASIQFPWKLTAILGLILVSSELLHKAQQAFHPGRCLVHNTQHFLFTCPCSCERPSRTSPLKHNQVHLLALPLLPQKAFREGWMTIRRTNWMCWLKTSGTYRKPWLCY